MGKRDVRQRETRKPKKDMKKPIIAAIAPPPAAQTRLTVTSTKPTQQLLPAHGSLVALRWLISRRPFMREILA